MHAFFPQSTENTKKNARDRWEKRNRITHKEQTTALLHREEKS